MISKNAGGHATVCIRHSGQLDFYWNYKLVSSTEQDETGQMKTKYSKIEVNFDEIKLTQLHEWQSTDEKQPGTL